MKTWRAHYKDAYHNIQTEIENQFTEENILFSLKLRLHDILFQGMSFDDFELADVAQFEAAAKEYQLLQCGTRPEYTYWLQRYALAVEIPVQVIAIQHRTVCDASICFSYELKEDTQKCSNVRHMLDGERVFPDMIHVQSFYLQIGEAIFAVDKPNLDFETSLLQICQKIKTRYWLKSCFGCVYADYSPYGNGYFGSMLCFVAVGHQYLEVCDKASLWSVYESGRQVQETFLCAAFQPRINCLGGYRGAIY